MNHKTDTPESAEAMTLADAALITELLFCAGGFPRENRTREALESAAARLITRNTQQSDTALKLQRCEEALRGCIETLTDARIGTWSYMEGSEIYDDFKDATDKAQAALTHLTRNEGEKKV